MFIKCDQHYQTYKLESHQRRTTIRKLTLSLHLLARSLALATSFFFFSIHACVLASASAYLYKISLAGVAPQADVHADPTDYAYNAEVSAYFRDSDSPQPPSAFRYVPPSPPRATSPINSTRANSRQSRATVQSWISHRSVSRQSRPASRQSVATVRSRADVHSRQSIHSLAAVDPVVEMIRRMMDNQRTDADRREQQMQVDIARRESQMEMSRRDGRRPIKLDYSWRMSC